ncbi:MAG: VWA domain-containing protein [Planctomycetota bacterium]
MFPARLLAVLLAFGPTVVGASGAFVSTATTTIRASSCPAEPRAPLEKYARKIEEWANRGRRERARLDAAEVAEWIEESFTVRAKGREDVDLALLRFLASCREDRGDAASEGLGAILLGALEERIAGRGGAGFEAYLLANALAVPSELTAEVRAAACEAIGTQVRSGNVGALVTATTDAELVVRLAALAALAGHPDARASRALVEACERCSGSEGATARTLLCNHLEELDRIDASSQAWPSDLTDRLPRAALPSLVAADWREASRGLRLSHWCAFETSAPRYIEALHTWRRREEVAEDPSDLVGVRRVRYEIAERLEEGAGIDLGIDPERWMQWWRSRDGSSPAPVVSTRSVAPGFFGLRVRSGAVAFVIDASGSMDYPIPGKDTRGSGSTRFEEATEQLERVLASLEEPSSFQVVLFNDTGNRWQDSAQRVSDTTRSSVRTWLRRNGPRGGTQLASGLDALLPRDQDGVRRPDLLDVDTVVVLCDGETTEDGNWARRWLAANNVEAQLVFHCVQIGGSRADALEGLAKGTGGRFVRIDH